MFAIFRYSLTRARVTILIWGVALAAYGAYSTGFYDTMIEQRALIEELMKQYPPELLALFGDIADFFTPGGYLNAYFFSYMPLIAGIYALLAGSGLLVSEEESGTLDLIMAHPISRSALFAGRLLSFLASLVLILAMTWLGFILLVPGTTLALTAGQLLLPFISLFAVLAFFGTLGLSFSMLLPSRGIAATLTGLVLVANFFMITLAELDENMRDIARYSPLDYYQAGYAVDGLNWGWLGGLLGAAAIFALFAWWLFERRDIRVGGEGSWRLPWRARRLRQEKASAP